MRTVNPSGREVLDTYTLAIFRDTWRYVALFGAMSRSVAIGRDPAAARARPNRPAGLGVRDGIVFAADGAKVRYCRVAEAARRPCAIRRAPRGPLDR